MKFNVIEMEIERGSKSDESNKSLPLGCASEARLYKNDPALPVYTWGLTKGMSTDKVAEILINGSVNRDQVATQVPTSVENNTVFIVDTAKLADKEHIKCDDLGAWTCTGSKKFIYSVDETGSFKKKHEEAQDKFYRENVRAYSVQRLFYTNKSMPSLRKTVITARDAISTVPRDLAFIQYVFTDGEREVLVKCHGNAKKERCSAYMRTMKSTMDMIKETVVELPARETVHKIINEKGGIMKIESSGELPRSYPGAQHC